MSYIFEQLMLSKICLFNTYLTTLNNLKCVNVTCWDVANETNEINTH